MEDESKPKTRSELAKKQREQSEKDKKAHQALIAEYRKIADTEAFHDLVKKVTSFQDYHLKLAKDGVGYEQERAADGKIIQRTVNLTSEQRTGHLDKAAGIAEISDYLDRILA